MFSFLNPFLQVSSVTWSYKQHHQNRNWWKTLRLHLDVSFSGWCLTKYDKTLTSESSKWTGRNEQVVSPAKLTRGPPPHIFRARTEVTNTSTCGSRPEERHVMLKKFSQWGVSETGVKQKLGNSNTCLAWNIWLHHGYVHQNRKMRP